MTEPYTITEFGANGKVRWSLVPGRALAEKWTTTPKLVELDQDAIIGGARDYLARVKKDATAPHELRLEFTNDAQLGGFSLEALKVCRDAGFDRFKVIGYVPTGGGFIPQLQVGPDGEAPGYKRYRGEEVDGKQFLADYQRMLTSL
mgnify:FL=1